MSFVLFFVIGTLAGALQSELNQLLAVRPDVPVVLLALFVSLSPWGKIAARAAGLALGAASAALDPLGVWILTAGLAALLILPLREWCFVERAPTQLLTGAVAAAAHAASLWIAHALGAVASVPDGVALAGCAAATALCTPVLAAGASLLQRALPAERLLAETPGRARARLSFYGDELSRENGPTVRRRL